MVKRKGKKVPVRATPKSKKYHVWKVYTNEDIRQGTKDASCSLSKSVQCLSNFLQNKHKPNAQTKCNQIEKHKQ